MIWGGNSDEACAGEQADTGNTQPHDWSQRLEVEHEATVTLPSGIVTSAPAEA